MEDKYGKYIEKCQCRLYLGYVVKHRTGLIVRLEVQLCDVTVVKRVMVAVVTMMLGFDVVQATDLHLDLVVAKFGS